MTPEEYADSIAKWSNQGMRQAVIDVIAAAVAAEREANCAAMCRNCAAGLKAVIGDEHTWSGRYVHFIPEEQRYVGCGANNIRSLK